MDKKSKIKFIKRLSRELIGKLPSVKVVPNKKKYKRKGRRV